MNCQMGKKSVALLNLLLKKAYPNQIDELRLHSVRGIGDTQVEFCGMIVEQLATQNQIKVFQLSGMSLNEDCIIQGLSDMIYSNQHIVELDISFAKISLQNLYTLTQALVGKEIENL